jgi:hypothetical protein
MSCQEYDYTLSVIFCGYSTKTIPDWVLFIEKYLKLYPKRCSINELLIKFAAKTEQRR